MTTLTVLHVLVGRSDSGQEPRPVLRAARAAAGERLRAGRRTHRAADAIRCRGAGPCARARRSPGDDDGRRRRRSIRSATGLAPFFVDCAVDVGRLLPDVSRAVHRRRPVVCRRRHALGARRRDRSLARARSCSAQTALVGQFAPDRRHRHADRRRDRRLAARAALLSISTSTVTAPAKQLYAPFSTSIELKLLHNGNTAAGPTPPDTAALGAPCDWIAVLGRGRQRRQGRRVSPRSSSTTRRTRTSRGGSSGRRTCRMRDVIEWLEYKQVVPTDVRLQTLDRARFPGRVPGQHRGPLARRSSCGARPEIGVRRALGASKRAIFMQLLVEAGAIGLVGGVLGLGLAWLGLWAVRHQPTTYADLAQLDLPMLAVTFALALASSLLAGLLPAWRGCRIAPAIATQVALRPHGLLRRSSPRFAGIATAATLIDPRDRVDVRDCLQRDVPGAPAARAHGSTERHRRCRAGSRAARPASGAKRRRPVTRARPRRAARDPGVVRVTATNMVPFGGSAWNSTISTIPNDPNRAINVGLYLGRSLIDTLGDPARSAGR